MTGIDAQFAQAESINPLANPEAEISLLGDLIVNNRLIDPAADKLRPVDFSVPLHGLVFGRMAEQAARSRAVDAITIAPFVQEEDGWPKLQRVLAAAHLNAGPPARTKTYLEQIVDLARRRRAVEGLQEVIRSLRTPGHDIDELVVQADEAVAELADETAEIEQAPVGEHAQRVVESFGKPIVGVRCGVIGSLDDIMGPLRPTELAVGGGRPGMGKTAMVTSYALGAAGRGHGVLMFSLEMSADQLTRRVLADMCHSPAGSVPYERIRDGNVRGPELDRVLAAKKRLDALPFEINDRGGLTLAMLNRRVRRHKRRLAAQGGKLDLVIIDYLQLMSPSRSGMSPYESATEISKGLKTLAKEEHLAVFALAQLSREVEKRTDKRPIASDLRDSGQIEQDADVLLFLYREEEYLRRSKPADEYSTKYDAWRTEMDTVRGKIEFIVPKRRSGPTGEAIGYFFGEYAAVRGGDFYRLGEGPAHG